MSSANNLAVVDGSKRSVMSFMKTLNRSGPRNAALAYSTGDLARAVEGGVNFDALGSVWEEGWDPEKKVAFNFVAG